MKISMSRREIVFTACLAGIAAWAAPTLAAPVSFKVPLTGAQQVPPVQTAATGTADLAYDPATRVLTWSVAYNGVSGPATMAHFHGLASEGKNAPPVIWLAEKGAAVASPIKGQATLTPGQANAKAECCDSMGRGSRNARHNAPFLRFFRLPEIPTL